MIRRKKFSHDKKKKKKERTKSPNQERRHK